MANSQARVLYQIGAVSSIAFGAGYVAIVALYAHTGAPPSGAAAKLAYLAAHQQAWWGILALSVATDLLLVPIAMALYFALSGVNRIAMLFATASMALFVFLDLAITWTNYGTLLVLSQNYSAAAAADKAAIVAAATYGAVVLESTLLFIYNSLSLAVGFLITGAIMRRSNFTRATAYLGVGTGLLGVIAVIGPIFARALSGIIILASVSTMIWVSVVGVELLRWPRRQLDAVASESRDQHE